MIYINTELGLFDFNNLISKLLKRAQINQKPEFFHALNLTGLRPEVLIKVTEGFIETLGKINSIRAIIIDGIADYVYNVNDPVSCNEVTNFFLGFAKRFNAVAVVIIHKNPGKMDTKSRGHLGSELARKCEATIELKPIGKTVMITGKELRNASPDFAPRLMQFDQDKGYFVSLGTTITIKQDKANDKLKEELTKLTHVFGDSESVKYTELVTRIIPEFKVKERMAKKRIENFTNAGFLVKRIDGSYALKK